MGQATSTQVQRGSGGIDDVDTLTNDQIGHNIENLFKSPHSTRIDSVRIERTDRARMSTSVVEVDTIKPMYGGNRSKVTVVPKRQRYKTVARSLTAKVGGGQQNESYMNSEDIRFLTKVAYQSGSGDEQMSDIDIQDAPTSRNVFSPSRVDVNSQNLSATSDMNPDFSATSDVNPDSLMTSDMNPALSATSDMNPDFSATSDVNPDLIDQEDEGEYEDEEDNATLQVVDIPVEAVNISSPVSNAQQSPVPVAQQSPVPVTQVPVSPNAQNTVVNNAPVPNEPVNGFVSNLVGGSTNTIDNEIRQIRKVIGNTVRQRGGNQQEVSEPAEKKTQDDEQMENILSDEGLAEIRTSLAKSGVINRTQNGGNIKGMTTGLNVDDDLKTYKDKILRNTQSLSDLSPTSADPSNFLEAMIGGADKKKASDDDDDEELDDDDDDDDDVDEDDDEDDDEDADDDDDMGEDEDGVTTQSGGEGIKDDSSSSSSSNSSSSSSSDSSSSSSDSEISKGAITVMHHAINRSMDRKKNNSKYLRNNGYKVTSNSDNDRNYKINNKLVYSSQTSDVHDSVGGGSDYLNSLRNRDRYM